MLGLKAFRQKPREFNYRPRYFDPEQEARDERKREILGDEAVDGHEGAEEYRPGQYIRQRKMRRGTMYQHHEKKVRNPWSVPIRIIALVALATFLLWFILVD